jgi:hypothetical protein
MARNTTVSLLPGPLGQQMNLARFDTLRVDLQRWRTNYELKDLETVKGSSLVLGFVRGLRLSAQLIYILRERLSATQLEVDWGHLLGPDGNSCSPECDVIIHKQGYEGRWNGDGGLSPVMDFKFIKCTEAVAVISCKSLAETIDKDYAMKLRPYVNYVLLFAECCGPKKIKKLKSDAKKYGYVGFWHLYAFDKDAGECTQDPKVWEHFLKSILRIIGK